MPEVNDWVGVDPLGSAGDGGGRGLLTIGAGGVKGRGGCTEEGDLLGA